MNSLPVLGWIVGAYVVGLAGNEKQVGFFRAMALSLFLSPLIGAVIVARSSPLPQGNLPKKKLLEPKELGHWFDLYKKGFISAEEYYVIKRELMSEWVKNLSPPKNHP